MADSLQKWIGRNRPPRVHITYDVETGGSTEKRSLPLVVGMLADLAGQPASPPAKLRDRRFLQIDRDNFDDIMAGIKPRLDMLVPDTAKGEGNLRVELQFERFADFHPENLVNQIPRLQRLLHARHELRDLLAKLDGNDKLDELLEKAIQNADALKAIQSEARAADPADGGTEKQ